MDQSPILVKQTPSSPVSTPTNPSQSDNPPSKITPNILLNTSQHSCHLSTTCSYNLTLKRLVCMVQESANMLYLQKIVVYSFSLGRLLFAQSILRFYEKAEVPLPPNIRIGFWPDAFLCQKFFRRFVIVSRYIVIICRNPQR